MKRRAVKVIVPARPDDDRVERRPHRRATRPDHRLGIDAERCENRHEQLIVGREQRRASVRREPNASSHALLLTGHVWIRRLRRVEARPMIGVADEQRGVEHHLRQSRVVRIVDVLRLVGHLVVVLMRAARQRNARDSVARVAVVIGAAVVLVGMSRRVVLDS